MTLTFWFSVTSRLASLQRFSMERLQCRESVLEHTGQVALTAMMLTREVQRRDPGLDVSLEEVLERALSHDLEEVVTGDIARPTKHATPDTSQMFAKISRVAMSRLVRDLEESGLSSFASCAERSHSLAKTADPEGTIVAIADVLAVACKVWEEVILCGSGAMIRQSHTCLRQLHAIKPLLAAIFVGGSPSHEFLGRLVDEACHLMHEAASRDSKWLATRVEEY